MDNRPERLKRKIDVMRQRLNRLLQSERPLSNKIIHLSQQLDELIIEYYKIAQSKNIR